MLVTIFLLIKVKTKRSARIGRSSSIKSCIKLKAILKEIISETTDSLRFYYLGEHHKTKVEQIGIKKGISVEEPLIF